jgi:hypothetical protein
MLPPVIQGRRESGLKMKTALAIHSSNLSWPRTDDALTGNDSDATPTIISDYRIEKSNAPCVVLLLTNYG